MNRLRRTFSFRKRKKQNKNEAGDSSKPQQWLDDEVKIKEGFCSFQVKYLGNIEVYESRGMQVCEEAIKALRKSKKPQKAVLSVSGDALRVSDDVSQHLIVDQTIEKVSFCAPDRNHEKGFAYICRDGATRRWMCHAFLAVKESATLAERLLDPQSTIVVDPVPKSNNTSSTSPTTITRVSSPVNHIGAIPRPHASPSIIERQGSLRIFPKLQENSPFKRDLSLRLEGVPSNVRRLAGIIQSAPIAEEPDTEFESKKLGVFVKSDERPEKSELVTVCSTSNWSSSIVVASSSSNLPIMNGLTVVTQSFVPSSHFTSDFNLDPKTSQAFIPSVISDPFSAAPINPATIQRHYQMELQQQQQHQQITGSSLLSSKAPMAVVSTISSTPTSPFLGGPPIAAPTLSINTYNSSPWAVTYSQMQPFNKSIIQYNSNLPSSPTGTMNSQTNLTYPSNGVLKSGSTNPWSSSMGLVYGRNVSNTNWQASSPSSLPPTLLPPEPDCISDPFDLGWVDRATAGVSNTSSGQGISNPFLIANGSGDDIPNSNASSVH
ncbi:unnamed protein product [Schistosoma rodhaini]|uniref:PID domain-containing protein n=1 Tax=Schistosoma rodhaini TaxID=6188 RepID=A0AA85FGB7_9TREM|nr:unnamed protein product [Schistosoma rodhaini]